jgi:hypothetical protein
MLPAPIVSGLTSLLSRKLPDAAEGSVSHGERIGRTQTVNSLRGY